MNNTKRFPDCQFNLFVATPCGPKPKHKGVIRLEKSTPYFADNGLGDGAGARLICQLDDSAKLDDWVTLTWLDWNEFEYEIVF